MSFARPSLPALIDRAQTDIESRLPGADARLRRSNLNVLARVNAGAAHGLYGYLDYIARQILPDEAEEEYLLRHARIWLPSGRIPAASAVGQIVVTGADGKTILADETFFKRADGAMYVATEEATIAGGSALVSVEAMEAGQAGNGVAGITLTLDSPIVGVNASAVVTDGALTGGADVEPLESLRARLIARIQEPPMGGSPGDYVKWALEVPGVTRAWCYPMEMGDGTVTVRFMRDGDADPIPDANEVEKVQAYIDARCPATAHVFVVAQIPVFVDFKIKLVPPTVSVKASVEANLRDLLLREAIPEDGYGSGRIRVSHIREAISLSAGETDHTLLLPDEDIVLTCGQMAKFGSIEWA